MSLGRLALAALLIIRSDLAVAQATVTIEIEPRDTLHAQTRRRSSPRKTRCLVSRFVARDDRDVSARQESRRPPADASKTIGLHRERVEGRRGHRDARARTSLAAVSTCSGVSAKFDRVADLGWHGTEAVLLADGMTYTIKGVAGRARPFLSEGQDPDDLYFVKGFKNGRLQPRFPSGHSTTAFAAAAAVTNETTRWWPRSTWIVGPLMYGARRRSACRACITIATGRATS